MHRRPGVAHADRERHGKAWREQRTEPICVALGGDLFHPGVGLLVLLAITVLNVYKPAGVTPYGRCAP